MSDSVLRHLPLFFILFLIITYILKDIDGGPLFLSIFLILIPSTGEAIQLVFPKQWGFEFEMTDVIINYVGSILGIGGMLLWHKFVIVVKKKQLLQL